MKVGVIGVGAMGCPMAENLARAGHEVVVYARTPARAERLRSRGVPFASSIREACRADAVITMLPDDTAIYDVCFESRQFLPAMSAECVHISMGTVGVEMTRKLTDAHAEYGSQFVSAPVFGRPHTASAAALIVLVAGPDRVIKRLSPVFDALCRSVFVIGPEPFQANVVKLCGNLLLLSSIEALAECLDFVKSQRMAPEPTLKVLTETVFTAPFYQTYGSSMLREDFHPAGFRLQLALKDVVLLLQEASGSGMSMPSAETLRQELQRASDTGLGDYDVASLVLMDRHPVRHLLA